MRKSKPSRETKKTKQPPKPRPNHQATTTDPRFYQLRNALEIDDRSTALKLRNEEPGVIHFRNGIGETVLHFLAVENHQEAVSWLLDQGADINTRNDFDGTPLADAVLLGYFDLCRFLLDKGASVGLPDHIGDTALSIAVYQAYEKGSEAHLSLLSLVLEKATPADIAASYDGRAKINEILTYGPPDLTALLLKHGFEPYEDD